METGKPEVNATYPFSCSIIRTASGTIQSRCSPPNAIQTCEPVRSKRLTLFLHATESLLVYLTIKRVPARDGKKWVME